MIVEETKLSGCFLIKPRVFGDDRGYFFESFNKKAFNEAISSNIEFVQDNISFSTRGVLRGLHFQNGDNAQAKLVSVIEGTVMDVVVDIRRGSKTFGQHLSVELSEENKNQLFIPKGFAHGFIVLSKTAKFFYKCDNYYNKASERGIIYNDIDLNIDWKLEAKEFIISEKDMILPNFRKALL